MLFKVAAVVCLAVAVCAAAAKPAESGAVAWPAGVPLNGHRVELQLLAARARAAPASTLPAPRFVTQLQVSSDLKRYCSGSALLLPNQRGTVPGVGPGSL